jgi:hypothetical protein
VIDSWSLSILDRAHMAEKMLEGKKERKKE